MKLNKFALTLTVAALLPTFAYANTDPVAASFERDLHREFISSSIAVTGEVEPLTSLFNAALYGTTDPVLASFERDMYHEPFNPVAVIAGKPASTNGTGDPVLASFEHDLRHEPVASAAVSGETDSLVDIFNVALRTETSESIKQVSVKGNYHGS